MQALIDSELKQMRDNFDDSTYQVKEKLNNRKSALDLKFYQRLFIIILTFCTFLIIPESPRDAEVLCKRYHPTDACNIW